jgi:hypothetical protein
VYENQERANQGREGHDREYQDKAKLCDGKRSNNLYKMKGQRGKAIPFYTRFCTFLT